MRYVLALILLLAACSRPLTTGEDAFARAAMAPDFDASRVRVFKGALIGRITHTRPTRPRVACREKIWPPPKGNTVKVGTAAFVLYNTIFLAEDLYSADTMPAWPDRMSLPAAMLVAHELTHVWQWQNRGKTGYTPIKSANEHNYSPDPYLFELSTRASYLDYGFEQQGGIMEEFVCCAALDPRGARTDRLRHLLQPHFDTARLEAALTQADIVLPWRGVDLPGICSDTR